MEGGKKLAGPKHSGQLERLLPQLVLARCIGSTHGYLKGNIRRNIHTHLSQQKLHRNLVAHCQPIDSTIYGNLFMHSRSSGLSSSGNPSRALAPQQSRVVMPLPKGNTVQISKTPIQCKPMPAAAGKTHTSQLLL
jgi:hypothetical protein